MAEIIGEFPADTGGDLSSWRLGLAARSIWVPLTAGNFQTRRKASPMFLLAAPPCKETSMCTIFAMEFTNSMTSSCRYATCSVFGA